MSSPPGTSWVWDFPLVEGGLPDATAIRRGMEARALEAQFRREEEQKADARHRQRKLEQGLDRLRRVYFSEVPR